MIVLPQRNWHPSAQVGSFSPIIAENEIQIMTVACATEPSRPARSERPFFCNKMAPEHHVCRIQLHTSRAPATETMPNIVYIATSLDGFIAEKDGGLDWLNNIPNPTNADYGYAKFISGIDAIIMGRNTYEQVLTFGTWPYEKPLFVLSNTIKDVPGRLSGKVEIISGRPAEVVSRMKDRGFQNLYLDGGATIQNFLRDDLVDEMIISTLPVLLGGGIPLFGTLDSKLDFRHVGTETFQNGIVKSHYKRHR